MPAPRKTEIPRQEPVREERPLWVLTLDEQRTMLMLVLSGLISILLGVAFLGVAVALARIIKQGDTAETVLELVLGIVGGLATLTLVYLAGRGSLDQRIPRVAWVAAGLAFLVFTVMWLTGIGLAAGIH
jgi:hypothetical protein